MRALANPKTLDLLAYLEAKIMSSHYREDFARNRRRSQLEVPTHELATLRVHLLAFNDILADRHEEGAPLYTEGDSTRFDWLFYLEEFKVIPVYDDAVALMRQRPLVEPQEVENILRFISVPGSKYGVDDVENHGFGYHFHFGKVKSNALKRFNVVLTFDHRQPVPTTSHDPLFAEEHGSGSYNHIDIATVGQNIRYPIYKICEQEMQNIGRQNFKRPAAKAARFY